MGGHTLYEAHAGMVGNESAYATAKHAALHNNGNEGAISPPSPGGNPLSNIC